MHAATEGGPRVPHAHLLNMDVGGRWTWGDTAMDVEGRVEALQRHAWTHVPVS